MTVVAPEWAADLFGIPFKDRGRTYEAADCWGVLRLGLAKPRFGVHLPELAEGYAGTEAPDGPQIATMIRAQLDRGIWHPIAKGAEGEGDGILIRMHGFAMHVGMVLVPSLGVHTMTTTGSVLLRYREFLHRDTVLGFYRHQDLMDRAHA